MSRPSKINNKEVTTLKNGYSLEVFRINDIINDINCSEDTSFIIKDIITQLENNAAKTLASGGTISLPYIGRLRKPLVKHELYKNKRLLKIARCIMNKEDYKAYAKELYRECVYKVSSNDEIKKIRKRLIALNRKRYIKKYNLFGTIGANVWIESLLWLQPIEFNQEVQDVFDEIERNENNNRKTYNG